MIDYDFDLVKLSALANAHFAFFTGRNLHSDRSLLERLTEHPEKSYLQCIPARFEHSLILREVVPCVVAQARRVLQPQGSLSPSEILALYGKALRTLQSALDDPAARLDPDVLCAAELLALYEVNTP